MKRHLHALRRYAYATLVLLLAIGVVWLSYKYYLHQDWTAARRYTLSAATAQLLDQFQQPVTIHAYISPGKPHLRASVAELLTRYHRHQPNIQWQFVNPYTQPEETRRLGITQEGQLLIEYQSRSTLLSEWNEATLSQTLHRLLRKKEQWIVFLSGHGERDPLGVANFDLGLLGEQLQAQGASVQTFNLGQVTQLPDNTSVLVIAGVQVRLADAEIAAIMHYVQYGGNLLWMLDSASLYGLDPLAEALGVWVKPGVLVDPESEKFFAPPPHVETLILAQQYSEHPLLEGFDHPPTLYVEAVGLSLSTQAGWEVSPLVYTTPRAWSETQTDQGVAFDPKRDLPGPFVLAAALTRARMPPGQQRIVVTGDGDFLANTYLGNGGNLELGLRLLNWLAEDDQLVKVPPLKTQDAGLILSHTSASLIGLGFLFLLPGLMLCYGGWIWWQRNRSHHAVAILHTSTVGKTEYAARRRGKARNGG